MKNDSYMYEGIRDIYLCWLGGASVQESPCLGLSRQAQTVWHWWVSEPHCRVLPMVSPERRKIGDLSLGRSSRIMFIRIQVLGPNRKHQRAVASRTNQFSNAECAYQESKSTEEWKLLGIWSSFCAKFFTETQVWLPFFIHQTLERFICSFIQHIFIQHLLCDRQCFQYWKYNSEQLRKVPAVISIHSKRK